MLIICNLFESDAGVGIPTPILRLFSAVLVCVFACRRQLAFLLSFITPPPPLGERNIPISMSVCLCVTCPRAYLQNCSPFFAGFSARYGPPLTALRYVIYFRFCGWHRVCVHEVKVPDESRIGSDAPGVACCVVVEEVVICDTVEMIDR